MRTFLILLGSISVAMGVLGIFLPLLPTTPFLLLGASCYARSSDRFYNWLLNNRWFGDYIKNYRNGKGIPLKQKLLTIMLLWLTIGFTVLFAISQWSIRLILLVIAIGVTIHLIKIKSYN
jgi:uncharacterized membrane protein YbaN (DUF454 family)